MSAFDTNRCNLWYLKVTPKHSLVRCLYNPFASCSTRTRKRSEQEHEEGWLSCHGHAMLFIITVENNRKHNQNHGSRKIKYFFLISWKIILENHGSKLLMKSQFTRKKSSHFTFHEKKIMPFTNLENIV